ncbi:MAG: L-2-hydroxyglutarate oxidase [Halopseudomonas sp.]
MYDYIIIGGGIVGVSTAWQLRLRQPDKRILLLEKEAQFAQHQSGHNSGVVHAGIYYEPGSLKARLCKQGLDDTLAFCREYDLPFEQCGKLLVATNALELERMQALYQRACDNGLEAELLDAEQLHRCEPHVAGLGAIRLKSTAIVDYPQICQKMVERFTELGGEVRLNTELIGLEERSDQIRVTTRVANSFSETEQGRFLICCCGLMADRTTRMLGIKTDFQIVPFRGEYYQLPPSRNNIVNHLIYPIPDPELPFLGVHLTRMIDGSITVGPNAVLGWKREGYGRVNVNLRDVWEMLRFPGFWKLATSHFKTSLAEYHDSLFKRGYLERVRKYCPELQLSDLQPYPAGIRAQAVLKDGSLVHDFLFAESQRSLHVCNAPSPAATSAIPIGDYICSKLAQKTAGID